MAGPDDDLDVLLVEDNPGDARLIRHGLHEAGGAVFEPPDLTHVGTLDEAVEALATGDYDLVLLDLGLERSRGLETLELLDERTAEPVPVVVLTGLDDQETAVEAIEAGAQDYLVKGDIDGGVLERAIRYAIERHRQERELERQNERLERFASVVSHDLRNPLNAARGTVETLADRADEDHEHFERVLRSHRRMSEIIDDVLTLAREGESVEDPRPVDLATLVEECRETVEADPDSVRVEYEGSILADPSRLRQILENLLRNAFEHGGEDVVVTVGPLPDGFYVADDGPGIPAEERDRAFEAGFTTSREGTGLGLNIVREVADAHGWTVGLTESAAGGARFEFAGVATV